MINDLESLKMAWIDLEQQAMDKRLEARKLQDRADTAKEKYREALWNQQKETKND